MFCRVAAVESLPAHHYIVYFVFSMLLKDLIIQDLFIFTAADVVSSGGRRKPPRTSLYRLFCVFHASKGPNYSGLIHLHCS